ncbi:MAG: hypothetical protein IJM44_03855 [Ruminococcus sp.]|nr:hypothetical protein [Ruminococcus sp.]
MLSCTWKRSCKEAFDEIVKNSGTQFGERVVEAFKAAFPQIEDTRLSCSDTSKLTFKTVVQT